MPIGLVARKCGMTRIFVLDEGLSIPVTVVEVEPNRITQRKDIETDGYCAIQVTKGEKKASRLTKASAGHFAKANVLPGTGLWEWRILPEEVQSFEIGAELTVSLFEAGQMVDVTGVTRGRGFTGVIKRHNFRSQRASHGNSLSHNAPGSIGQNQSPGRVFKGKKMAGQYGNVTRTVQNLEVIRVDLERNVLLIKGAVPGAPGGDLFICPAVKQSSKSTEAA
jgi:large subunit ribosomal protein L3